MSQVARLTGGVSPGSIPTIFTAEDATTATPAANIINIVGTSTNGIDTTAAGNTLTIGMGTGLYADFSFLNLAPATGRSVTIYNGDTDAASTAELRFSIPTAGADAMIVWEVMATRFYSLGVDNSDGDAWKLTNSSSPSGGDALISVTPTGVVSLFNDLDVTEGGTGVSTLTSHGILMGNGAGDIQATAEPSDGQILIGDTGGFPILGNITSSGGSVIITNGPGTINLEANIPSSFSWVDATNAAYNLTVQTGYTTHRAAGVTYTLPATAVQGDEIKIDGYEGLATVAQNAGQQIGFGNANTTAGVAGSIVATNLGDCVTLRCMVGGAATFWRVESSVGNWTIN